MFFGTPKDAFKYKAAKDMKPALASTTIKGRGLFLVVTHVVFTLKKESSSQILKDASCRKKRVFS